MKPETKKSLKEKGRWVVIVILLSALLIGATYVVREAFGVDDDCPDCECGDPTENDLLDFHRAGVSTVFTFTFYDNHEGLLRSAPNFTPDAWTDLPEWTMAQHEDTFTQTQKDKILWLTANLAYYDATGEWLGE